MSKLVSAPRWTPPMPPVAKTPMPARCGRDHRRGDGGGAGAAGGEAGGEIGAAELGDAAAPGQRVELAVGEADVEPPVEHRDGGRDGARGAHLGLDGARGLDVLRAGHAVGDDGAFERDEGRAVGLGGGDFGRIGDVDHGRSVSMAGSAWGASRPDPRAVYREAGMTGAGGSCRVFPET